MLVLTYLAAFWKAWYLAVDAGVGTLAMTSSAVWANAKLFIARSRTTMTLSSSMMWGRGGVLRCDPKVLGDTDRDLQKPWNFI